MEGCLCFIHQGWSAASQHPAPRKSKDDDHHHVDGERLHLWTAAINGPIVHSPGDIWAWRSTVKWYRQGKTPDSSTRGLRQSYKQSNLVAKQEELAKENEFCLTKYLFHTSKGSITCHKILRHGADYFTSPPKKSCSAGFLSPLRNSSPSAGFEPAILGSSDKHEDDSED
jgi:hypothetical protein